MNKTQPLNSDLQEKTYLIPNIPNRTSDLQSKNINTVTGLKINSVNASHVKPKVNPNSGRKSVISPTGN